MADPLDAMLTAAETRLVAKGRPRAEPLALSLLNASPLS